MTAQSTPRLSVAVQSTDFDLGCEYTALLAHDLEHYPGMTEKSLRKILDAAVERWSLQGARIVHRIGKMYPGDQIVLVLTASAHRGDAYEANNFIMDYLKTEAPFWKKEWTPDGPRWIEARDSDDKAAARWK
jgi:molybdopterin synthase catalytic subunit